MDKLLKLALRTGIALLGAVFVLTTLPIHWRDEIFLIVPISAVLGVIGFLIVLCLVALWRVARGRMGWRSGLGVPAVTVTVIYLILPAFWAGERAYVWGVMILGRGWLDRTVAQAQARPDAFIGYENLWIPRTDDTSLIPVIADKGPPVRVIFRTSTWLMGEWAGIVFDPDGGLTVKGGPLSCDQLRGPYYYCRYST